MVLHSVSLISDIYSTASLIDRDFALFTVLGEISRRRLLSSVFLFFSLLFQFSWDQRAFFFSVLGRNLGTVDRSDTI
jgi:hypothetical protein